MRSIGKKRVKLIEITMVMLFTVFMFSPVTNTNASKELAQHEEYKGCQNLESTYTTEDYELLAHIINAEVGADYCTDEMRYYVGSVVLNRVEDKDFPNTIREVVFQEGQYYPCTSGTFWMTPSDNCYKIAKDLLEAGSRLPVEVVYQANFTQGSGLYIQVQNEYFCYK